MSTWIWLWIIHTKEDEILSTYRNLYSKWRGRLYHMNQTISEKLWGIDFECYRHSGNCEIYPQIQHTFHFTSDPEGRGEGRANRKQKRWASPSEEKESWDPNGVGRELRAWSLQGLVPWGTHQSTAHCPSNIPARYLGCLVLCVNLAKLFLHRYLIKY